MEIIMATMNETLLIAKKKGYFVNKSGDVIGPKGKRSLRKHNYSGIDYYNFTIKLYDGRSSNSICVHRLQAFQKFGEKIFEKGIVVRHINGNSLDNSYDNIQIGTISDNSMDRDPKDRLEHSIKAAVKNRVLTDDEVKQVRLRREQGLTYQEIADEFGLSGKGQAHYIVNNDYKTKV